MNYIIREAKESDVKELSHLKLDIWETCYRGIYPDEKFENYDFKKEEDKFKNIMLMDYETLLVVEDNNKLVAYVAFGYPIREYKDFKREIGLLYILKEYRHLGLGRELFNKAYESIKNEGYREFFISCNKYNTDARAFYEKMGGELIDIDEDNVDKSLPQVKYLYTIN